MITRRLYPLPDEQEMNLRTRRVPRGGSRTTSTSKMEHFVIIVNGWKPLTIITKRSILDVAAVLDPSLVPVVEGKSHTEDLFSTFFDISVRPKTHIY